MSPPTPEPPADINPDLTCRVLADTRRIDWEPSPSGAVWRKPLYRQGASTGL